MIKLMSTAAVLLTLAAATANAQFTSEQEDDSNEISLTCSGVKQLFASRQEKLESRYEDDPVSYITVEVTLSNGRATAMEVKHVFRSGREVSRSDQYDMGAKLRTTKYSYVWSGTLNRNSNVQMSGVLERSGRGWTYTETRFDRGQRTWANIAVCS